jgi:hypothetical protein
MMREVDKLDPLESTPETITAALRTDGISMGCWAVDLGTDATLQLTLRQDGTCVMTAERWDDDDEETDEARAEMRCEGSWARGDDGLSVLLQLQQPVETGDLGLEFLPLRAVDVPARATGTLRWESTTLLVFEMGGKEVVFDPPGAIRPVATESISQSIN